MFDRTPCLLPGRSLTRTLVNPVNAAAYLETWLHQSLIPKEDWDDLPVLVRDELQALVSLSSLFARPVELKLLTQYQAERIEAGTTHGLVLGNYRVLILLGAGELGWFFSR